MHCIQNLSNITNPPNNTTLCKQKSDSCAGTDVERFDPATYCPNDITLLIFSYLGANELGRGSIVSRKWQQLVSNPVLWEDLGKFFPSLNIFDEACWKKYVDLSSFGLDVKDISPLDNRILTAVLKRYLSSLQIEKNSGFTLLTIPKGLTLNKLIKIAELTESWNIKNFNLVATHILSTFGDMSVDKTYRIVITKNILEGSRSLSIRDQKDLLHKFGWEMPKILELITLLVVTHMISQERLYDDPCAFTTCSEEFDGNQLIVGGFVQEGFHIGAYPILRFGVRNCGVGGALRKF